VTSKETALTVRFSEAQADTLARLAEIEDRSKGAGIRRAVDRLDVPPAEPEDWEPAGMTAMGDDDEGDRPERARVQSGGCVNVNVTPPRHTQRAAGIEGRAMALADKSDISVHVMKVPQRPRIDGGHGGCANSTTDHGHGHMWVGHKCEGDG
jgi:hypothetical protein